MALADRENLVLRLQQAFADPEVAKAALASLDGYKGHGGDGLKLAAIKASGGQLWKLRELLQVAKKDFRDVYLEANSPDEARRLRDERRADPTLLWGRLQYLIKRAKRKTPNKPGQ
jgi:hypothetical protein